MAHFTLSKREWVNRFAVQFIRLVTADVTLDDAITLGRREYDHSFDSSPESAVYRLLGGLPAEELSEEAAWLTSRVVLRMRSGERSHGAPSHGMHHRRAGDSDGA